MPEFRSPVALSDAITRDLVFRAMLAIGAVLLAAGAYAIRSLVGDTVALG